MVVLAMLLLLVRAAVRAPALLAARAAATRQAQTVRQPRHAPSSSAALVTVSLLQQPSLSSLPRWCLVLLRASRARRQAWLASPWLVSAWLVQALQACLAWAAGLLLLLALVLVQQKQQEMPLEQQHSQNSQPQREHG